MNVDCDVNDVVKNNLCEGKVEVEVIFVKEDVGGPFGTSTWNKWKGSKIEEIVKEDY